MERPTLIHGDCTKFVSNIVSENKSTIIVTDPPFNIGYHYKSYKDKLREEEYLNLIEKSLGGAEMFVIIHYPEALYKISAHLKKIPNKVVSWVYNSNTGKQHRDIAFFGVEPNFRQVKQPYKNPNDKRVQKLISEGRGARLYDWWNINQVKNVSKEKTSHPCQMPVEVMRNIIGILPRDSVIVDPFMGSGTTGVASVEQGLKFYGIELDKEYFCISEARIDDALSRTRTPKDGR